MHVHDAEAARGVCEKISLKKAGIKGVFCGGTEMTPQFHRFAVEELLDGRLLRADIWQHADGLAVHKPRRPEDNWAIIYYPPSPRAMIEVVDFDDTTKLVGYGETGRVRLTTLTKEFFMPRFLERDEVRARAAVRARIRGTACATCGRSRASARP